MEKDSFLGASAPESGFYPPQENPPAYFQAVTPSGYSAMQPTPYPPQPTHTVIQVTIPPIPVFGTRPANIRCSFCNQDVQTIVKRRFTGFTHLMACILSFFCCCCFAWVPYVSDCLNDIEHECPACGKFLGVFARTSGRRY